MFVLTMTLQSHSISGILHGVGSPWQGSDPLHATPDTRGMNDDEL